MYIKNEYSSLNAVIVGIGHGFEMGDICNSTIAKNINKLPVKEDIVNELDKFANLLSEKGINVYKPSILDYIPDQTCPRDIGFVIDNHFIVSNTMVSTRKDEFSGVSHHFDHKEYKVTKMPDHCYLEGGDLIVYHDYIFAGLGERSNKEAINFLCKTFPHKKIVPIKHTVLHLDCCFNILSDNLAIVVPDLIDQSSIKLIQSLFKNIVEVEKEHQEDLVTNFLIIAPKHIIARDHSSFDRYSDLLSNHGVKIERIKFDAVPKLGGSFRCATLPILRSE